MSKGKILFIDDDNFLRKVYEAELSEKGFEVALAVDGDEGLEKVAAMHPDLIILDLIMPKKNGFEVLADLQRFEETRAIPVIVLSNLAQSEDQKKALDLGAVDYLVKDNTTLDIIAQKIEYHLHNLNGAARTPKPVAKDGLTAELARRKGGVAPGSAAAPATQEAPRGVQKNFCSNCGTKVKKSDKFCPNCGIRLE